MKVSNPHSMHYELMLILDPKQSEKEIENTVSEVKAHAQEHGLTVKDEDVWGVRRLAYKIKGHNDGYYIVILLEGEGTGTVPFRKEMEIQSGVLRYMLVKMADDYNVIVRHSGVSQGVAAKQVNKHAEELAKKVSSKQAAKPKADVKADIEEETTEADTAKLDEQLKAIEDDTDIDL